MKRFGEFAQEEAPLDGAKLKIDDVLNREIVVTGCRVSDSRYTKAGAERCLKLQFELDGVKHVLFTGSGVLIDQVQKYKEEIPFIATIRKIDKYYTLS